MRALLLVATCLALALPAAAAARNGSAVSLTPSETALLAQVNRTRAEHGLAPLRADAQLERAARAHSREMLASDEFAHGAFADRMTQFAVRSDVAGENLAWGTGSFGTPRGIVEAWLASPPHRANLLQPSFSRIGIGSLTGPFQGEPDARVVTADFAG